MTNRKAIRRARRIRRTVLTVCLMALVAVLSIGATVAYLTAKTNAITNTFTVGDIEIALEETAPADPTKIQIVPGTNIAKNPKVSVLKDSEHCWLFVMFKEENWPATDNVSYSLNKTGWTQLTTTGLDDTDVEVYYREVSATDAKAGVSYELLTGNQVTVSPELNETEMQAIEDGGNPKLSFKAFAVQYDNLTYDKAWEAIDEDQKTFVNP